ncbi:hypothetical protein J7E25_13760 [Agromyces sp. ISL-38]|uniref:hypothetical protein n=1 Tax=Agromyces sp. ISL-38 TaxID=2819107 RepID=UPI001BE63001|nr:hypothetical protein [Agromyces sp. ISL-38]MBT2500154.1 hypothetical protein [Agromyces sp. ISL-38]
MSTELVARFERPSVRYGPVPLWWWSGERLDPERLRWQMRQLVEQGIWQAVVMNLAPTGPLYGALADDPPFMSEEWWEIFAGACADAEELGFQIWLYDQIGFSGANLQGRVIAAHPQFAGRSLSQARVDATSGDVELAVPEDADALGAWFAAHDGSPVVPVSIEEGRARHRQAPGELVLCFASVRGFDYFSPAACDALLDSVYGEYERRVGKHFGRGIGGVFQDELPDVPTWSNDFASRFRDHTGYDLLEVLPALWGDALPTGAAGAEVDADRVRLDYHSARARFARAAFFDPLAARLDQAGLACGFDQQSPAREGEPIGATAHYGDYLETHSTYAIPGSDHWGDSKIHSSLAHAHGHERVWIEAFHSSGWGGTLEETYDWLSPFLRRGANLYDPHAVYYSTRSGWFEWAPPSTCWRQPYWPGYHVFAEAVTRLSSVLTAGEHVASTVLLFPTEFVQSRLTADGRDLGARDAERVYFDLNGMTPWYAEQRGILERAGVDYDTLGAHSLRAAEVSGDELRLRGERYRNVVLPATEVIPADVAALLAALAEQGGRVICIGAAPTRFVDRELAPDAPGRFAALLSAGRILRVDDVEDVPRMLRASAVSVVADAPVLHRVIGDTHLIAAIAHDERTGTVQPMLPEFGEAWESGDFNWKRYWQRLSSEGYHFVPPAGRALTVRLNGAGLEGLDGVAGQLWDPRTGLRRDVPLTRLGDGAVEAHVDFSVGSIALLVVGPDLPAATAPVLGERRSSQELDGPWLVSPESTLDNSWGDLDDVEQRGVVPIQVWEFDHEDDENGDDDENGEGGANGERRRVLATFGPFAEVAGPDGDWTRAEWSLSRGIRKDPIHDESLGPNGYVPEEFLLWRGVTPGGRYRVRTTITVPDDPAIRLAVGANAGRSIRVDGVELAPGEPGYLTFHAGLPTGSRVLEIEFTAAGTGDLRAYFALTTDLERFARPEWIEAADEPARSTSVVFSTTFEASSGVADARVQLSSEAPSTLVVNGVEIGRQSDFDPYAARRFTRVHPYDLRDVLRDGGNILEVRSTDVGRPVAIRLDSVPAIDGGLGIRSDASWTVTRELAPVPVSQRLMQYEDPRYGCLVPRPHPLQRAGWLERESVHESVVTLVPDVAPRPGRVETLTFDVPIGTIEATVPTSIPWEVRASDVVRSGDRLVFDRPAAMDRRLTLSFRPEDGRRAGALLDGPIAVTVTPVEAELRPWDELGLSALGGAVRYARRCRIERPEGTRAVLDLGLVRGTTEVRVDGVLVDTLFAGPWRSDVSEAVEHGGEHLIEVTVRGTLAPYLDVASPTSAVMAGQTRHGLFGPVRLEIWERTPRADTGQLASMKGSMMTKIHSNDRSSSVLD